MRAPIANALLDVWSGDGEGNYDMQMEGETGMKARGRIRTDAEGRYWFRSIRPTFYPVPSDGPVGDSEEEALPPQAAVNTTADTPASLTMVRST